MQHFWTGFFVGVVTLMLPSLVALVVALAFARPDPSVDQGLTP